MIPVRLLPFVVVGLLTTGCKWTDLEEWQDDHDTGDGPQLIDADGDGVLEDEDCNDLDDTVFPGADEIAADGVDSNCDGTELCYSDGDGDGYGTADLVDGDVACSEAGLASLTDDCDDINPAVNPGAEEICDGYDNDCDGAFDDEDSDLATVTQFQDNDGDGHAAPGAFSVDVASCERVPGFAYFDDDCDDADASVSPSADEICNGLDDDCDAMVDDTDDDVLDPNTYWADADADGAGDAAVTIDACTRPTGYVGNADDCDDSDDTRKPGAAEVCDGGVDNDCDGLGDDDDSTVVGAPTWFVDADGDDYGKSGAPLARCVQPAGYAAAVGDCNDTNDQVNPDATEVCNGLDDDCDGVSDGAGAVGAVAYYQDIDGDDHGGIGAASVVACNPPTGFVALEDDCNDVDANTFPGAVEICDSLDNDCDSEVDEDAVTIPWYRDDDGDGWGQTGVTQDSCVQPPGYVQKQNDCDDTNSAVKPGATEICNGYDDNCDGDVDDDDTALVANTYYADSDADTYGNAGATAVACAVPTGFVTNSTDCDDTDADKNPGEAEVCDSVDNDCDGLVDDADTAVTGAPTWYRDSDADTYGNPNNTSRKCIQPAGFIADNTDCDDAKAGVNPAANELCSTAFDDNCDGTANEVTAADALTWYADTDSDLFGDLSSSTMACTRPSGYRADATDCDDTDSNTYPGATEICDELDNDCDSIVDENAQPADWYPDGDNDGFGDADATPESACTAPAGKVADDSDCDDGKAGVNPAADELCSTPYDDDCDGATNENNAVDVATWYADTDSDTFGNSGASQKACTKPTGFVGNSTDCDDGDTNVFPGATEVCDSIDNDCDNQIDDADSGITGQPTWYRDNDGDTFGNPTNTTLACTLPTGFLADNTDCDDTKSAVNPDADEQCSTAYDDDCDGQVNEASAADATVWYADSDNDNHGSSTSGTIVQCTQPVAHYALDDDCDDADPTIYAGATEICDLKDNDCDSSIDEGANPGEWYLDGDGDGYGDMADVTPQTSCGQPAGRVANNTDCDDSKSNTHPNASEICDGFDNDCDGPIDEQATDAVNWYVDTDGDTFGDPGTSVAACSPPGGWVGNPDDCVDSNPSINPSANEVCDGSDNDCDGQIDDADASISGRPTWFRDFDGDSFGNPGQTQLLCTQPGGYVNDSNDCDDSKVAVNPDADERCATTWDDDCDGQVNEPSAIDTTDWYRDNDGDNFGSSVSGVQAACSQPANHYAADNDCDDTLSNTYPGASEICDTIDNDCDGEVDENAGTQDWYIDGDDDGFGDSNDLSPVESCTAVAGRAANNADCEDTDPSIRPTATEVCDGIDNDCDTDIDDQDLSISGQPTWYRDNDLDGYGNAAVTQKACDQPGGFESDNTDCDDTDGNNFPGNTEVCDGSDNNCDGDVDDDDPTVSDQTEFWLDSDYDGFGDPGSGAWFCLQPGDHIDNYDDCDDTDALVNPDADELCSTPYDDNCDGTANDETSADVVAWYYDSDGDGYAGSDTMLWACDAPNQHYAIDDDCDDFQASINPGATETCNSEDDDCDGEVDEDTTTQQWYIDSDGDNFGDQYDYNPEDSCVPIAGKAPNNTDCRDDDFAIKPSAQEVCDGDDNDCDGYIDDEDGSLVGGSTW